MGIQKAVAGQIGASAISSVSPSEAFGLVRPILETDLTAENIRGRLYFLWALQEHWPAFWHTLKSDVFDKCKPFPRKWAEFSARHFSRWLERIGVTDQWLCDACWQTMVGWIDRPGPLLTADHQVWFTYASNEPVLPLFDIHIADRPRYMKPVPNVRSIRRFIDAFVRDAVETPAEFEKRITAVFVSELDAYLTLYKKRTAKRESMEEHAAWAALMFSGKSAAEVRISWQGMSNMEDPDQAVYRAATRFAKEIGLSLQCTKKKQKSSTCGKPGKSE